VLESFDKVSSTVSHRISYLIFGGILHVNDFSLDFGIIEAYLKPDSME